MYEIEAVILRDDETISGNCPSAVLKLPANHYELADVLEQARISEKHSGFTLNEYRCRMPGLAALLPQRIQLDALNLLAYRLAGLSKDERLCYEGLLKIDTKPKTIGNLINLTYNLCNCQYADVHDDRQLGNLLIENGLVPELENIPSCVLGWLDYAAVGRAQREAEHGVFISGGYVVNDAAELENVYPEELLLEQMDFPDSPIDGIFRVYPETLPEGVILPADTQQEQELLSRLQMESLEECILLNAESSIPSLNPMLEPFESFDYLNDIAAVIATVPETERRKFKAVLEYEDCTDLSMAATLSQQLDMYSFYPELDTAGDYGKLILARRAQLSPNDPTLNLLYFDAYGSAMMMRDNAHATRYGIIRRNQKSGEGF